MRYGLIIACFTFSLLLVPLLFASEFPRRSYAVDDRIRQLRGDGHVVVREDFLSFELRNKERAHEKILQASTVFDAQGRDEGEFSVHYSSMRKVKNIHGAIFDATGAKVKELDADDMRDLPVSSEYSLFTDDRVKSGELYYDKYPYTVEFSYEVEWYGLLSWPSWFFQLHGDPVENSFFEIVLPSSEALRYWTNADSVRPAESQNGDTHSYLWEAHGLPKLTEDQKDEDIVHRTAIILTAPSQFKLDDYEGKMTNWESFGKWIAGLYQDRIALPPEAVRDVHALTDTITSERGRIAALYRYMQGRVHYVLVSLGIGGWQPFDATYVHTHGYGDCKALSNYMTALLKEAGITSYPVVVNSGAKDPLYRPDFVRNEFNHVIACVPMQKDTMWLECTSQSYPPGHLSDETQDRFALMITPDGGVVVNTPTAHSSDNQQQRTSNATLSYTGDADVTISTRVTGNQQDYVRYFFTEGSKEDQDKYIHHCLRVPTADIHSSSVEGLTSQSPEITLAMQVILPRYGSVSGSRLFFQPNMMEQRTFIPRDNPKRKSPWTFSYPYLDSDSLVFHLPSDYTVEALPPDVSIDASFGSYRSSTKVAGDGTLVYTRRLEIRETEIPAAQFQEYRKFSADIVKADRAQVALIKKTP